jgi:hypothetical protein
MSKSWANPKGNAFYFVFCLSLGQNPEVMAEVEHPSQTARQKAHTDDTGARQRNER